MRTLNLLNPNTNLCRRRIVIAEINILRNFEERALIQEKIVRKMGKLHSLWFRDTTRNMYKADL